MPERELSLMTRNEFIRRHQARLDELFTGDSFENIVVGKAGRLFRKRDWFEIALQGDLNDAPYLADVSRALTDQDRVAAEAWAAWMTMLGREQLSELVTGPYRPAEVYETYTHPIGALCAPEWSAVADANRALFTTAFASWVCFSESDRWALFCYCENIAILGGSAEYMSEFRSLIGGFGRLREVFPDVVEEQLGPAWVDNSYRKLVEQVRWPRDE